MARSPNCYKCGELKSSAYERYSYCGRCKSKKRSEDRARARVEKGLPVWRIGRNPLCPDCNAPKQDIRQGWCNACRSVRERARKIESGVALSDEVKARRKKEYIFKTLVRGFTRNCIRRGILIKGSCEICGTNEEVEAHHDDYNKPMDIRWLCREHHNAHHVEADDFKRR